MTEKQPPRLRVFVENEAGSNIKHHYNEETFEVLRTEQVGARYPYPYGFVPGTLAPDGDCADCFVLTEQAIPTGEFVDCEPVALLEQTEGGDTDHNVLAVMAGEATADLAEAQRRISRLIEEFRADTPDQRGVAGRLLPVTEALAYVEQCLAARERSEGQPG